MSTYPNQTDIAYMNLCNLDSLDSFHKVFSCLRDSGFDLERADDLASDIVESKDLRVCDGDRAAETLWAILSGVNQ